MSANNLKHQKGKNIIIQQLSSTSSSSSYLHNAGYRINQDHYLHPAFPLFSLPAIHYRILWLK